MQELCNLASKNEIANISFSPAQENYYEEESWERVLKEIVAYNTVNNGVYTGNGIKVGVLETGICDTGHTNLESKNIVVDPSSDMTKVTSHATAVTSIIALMAPEAQLYVSNVTQGNLQYPYGTDTNGNPINSETPYLYDAIDWFIAQDCDVINCSYGVTWTLENNGIYTFDLQNAGYKHYQDGIIDYKIEANMINVVVSAGNVVESNTNSQYNPDGYITSPGQAYKAITVGALNCTQKLFSYELEHRSTSCYKTPTNRVKPEISAIGVVDIPNIEETKTGTSFAAPQVTASLALLFEKEPALAVNESAVKAAVIASATETENYTNIANSCFDEKVGAGCLNYSELTDFDSIDYVWNRKATNTPDSYIISRTISLGWRDDLQVAAVWGSNFGMNYNGNITNYDIEIYNSSGTLVCSSTLDYCSSEFLRYKAPRSGDYTVKVYQNGSMPDNVTDDCVSLVCNIIS